MEEMVKEDSILSEVLHYLPDIIKHTDENLLEGKDNVVWLFFLLPKLKKARQ